MTDKRNNLEKLFAAARTEPPVITFNETRAYVDGNMLVGSTEINKSNTTRHIIMITTGIGILAATLIGFLSWNSGSVQKTTKAEQTIVGKLNPAQGENGLQVVPTQESQGKGTIEFISAKDNTNTKDQGSGKQSGKNDQGGGEKNTDGMYSAPAPFISGIRMIELSREELGKLGLQPDSDGVWIFNGLSGDVDGYKLSMRGLVDVSNVKEHKASTTTAPTFKPTFITDDFGNRRVMEIDDNNDRGKQLQEKLAEFGRKAMNPNITEDEMKALENEIEMIQAQIMEEAARMETEDISSGKLIPILVRTGRVLTQADTIGWRPDCIFWYKPTPEFLAALPDRVRIPLERELRLASVLHSKPDFESVDAFLNRQPLEIRDAFDSLRSNGDKSSVAGVAGDAAVTGAFSVASGAITASAVLPNPAKDYTILQYRLASLRTISVALYDVNGKLVRTLSEPKSVNPGENTQRVELENVFPGMYLLVITTEKGERAIQRVIVE